MTCPRALQEAQFKKQPRLKHIQGGPKVTSQRFELIAWPLIIGSAKFVQECAGTVTGSRNI